jgi:hypothetical protein
MRESRPQTPRVPRSSTPSCGFVHIPPQKLNVPLTALGCREGRLRDVPDVRARLPPVGMSEVAVRGDAVPDQLLQLGHLREPALFLA